jgi:stearoyl-CoA desaturase (delta-9 desaturase)
MRPFRTDPEGTTWLDPLKLARFTLWHVGLLAAPFFWDWTALTVSAVCAWWAMGLGLTVGLHRGLIHRAFAMDKRVERALVTLGMVNGLGGPIGMSTMHHMRDHFQNQPTCPPYFGYQRGFFEAMGFALLFRFEPARDPGFVQVWPETANDPYYQWLERWGFWLQVPIAAMCYLTLGFPGLVWGMGVRMALTQDGFWFVHYVSHTLGKQPFEIRAAAEQGRNVRWLAIPSLGESWHNNHHAYPTSARMGITDAQSDLGYVLIRLLAKLGLVRDVLTPETLPLRESARLRAPDEVGSLPVPTGRMVEEGQGMR